ncbi:hypothetical protein [Naasia lichenicola]|uniref:Uncharacterized protein n=1 Tax=Naasia lichenicola TaxID=2565933 RepID=A0A4S4FTE4_9MICO|nr:hypothetical protein [Naasia lichenicola]THG33222.1 hypothetical protein E6C64_02385 [Naasia lichenicola]
MLVDRDAAVTIWTAVGALGVLALTIAAPYFAGFLADALLIGVRRRRVRAIVTSIPIALAVAAAGYWTWQVAIAAPGDPAQVRADLAMVADVLMPVGFALAAIAFVVRQVRSVVLIRGYRGRTTTVERTGTHLAHARDRTGSRTRTVGSGTRSRDSRASTAPAARRGLVADRV